METIIKGFLGCFLLLIVTFSGYGIFAAGIEARNADAFLSDAVTRIESSDYAMSVIRACQDDAAETGYVLNVEGYQPSGSSRTSYGQAVLTYEFKIPFLQIAADKTIRADLN